MVKWRWRNMWFNLIDTHLCLTFTGWGVIVTRCIWSNIRATRACEMGLNEKISLRTEHYFSKWRLSVLMEHNLLPPFAQISNSLPRRAKHSSSFFNFFLSWTKLRRRTTVPHSIDPQKEMVRKKKQKHLNYTCASNRNEQFIFFYIILWILVLFSAFFGTFHLSERD